MIGIKISKGPRISGLKTPKIASQKPIPKLKTPKTPVFQVKMTIPGGKRPKMR